MPYDFFPGFARDLLEAGCSRADILLAFEIWKKQGLLNAPEIRQVDEKKIVKQILVNQYGFPNSLLGNLYEINVITDWLKDISDYDPEMEVQTTRRLLFGKSNKEGD